MAKTKKARPKPAVKPAKLGRAKGAAKRTPDQRAADLNFIADLASQGYGSTAICAMLNQARKGHYTIGERTIDEELKVIRAEWAQNRVFNLNEFVSAELRLLNFIQTEAIDGWKKSKQRAIKREAERATFSEGGKRAGTRAKKSIEDRDGSPEFLITAVKCHERRCKLLGLDKPVKNEFGGIDGAPLPIANVPHLLEIKILNAGENADTPAK